MEKTEAELRECEEQSMQADFYNDMEAAGKVMQKIKGLRDKLSRYAELKALWEDLGTLIELAIEEQDESVLDEVKSGYKTLCVNLENMKLETMFSGKYDKNNAIVTLHAGAGGTEAQDWCEMLYRMYTRWAER
ncbi:MAG: PCRF domain-containing protein, partial [Clostridia bacterium]|nr:PCRF domain-containing protein [Clostridia bacterium]